MLHEFIRTKREAIVANALARATTSRPSCPENRVSVFLDQLGDALDLAMSSDVIDHHQIGTSAGRHGNELERTGLTIGQVVHEYGSICQSITELAIRMDDRAAIDAEAPGQGPFGGQTGGLGKRAGQDCLTQLLVDLLINRHDAIPIDSGNRCRPREIAHLDGRSRPDWMVSSSILFETRTA